MNRHFMIVTGTGPDPFAYRPGPDDNLALLTTEHAASVEGRADLVHKGQVYTPGELPGLELVPFADAPRVDINLVRESGWLTRTVATYESWAASKFWDGICAVCGHDWVNACHGDCTCLGCNAERQEYELL